jgi:hypothetical protein
MSNKLFENAVNAVKLASASENELKAKLAEVQELSVKTDSSITVACTDAYAWFISVNRKHGSKAQLAEASGVSQKTIGRYIAGGHVALVTNGKIEAGVACNAINNYKMNLSDIEKVKSLSDWNKLVKACKEVLKNGAGNNGNGKNDTENNDNTDNTENENTEADNAEAVEYWVQLADLLAEEIASGAVSLQVVAEYITELVASNELVTV